MFFLCSYNAMAAVKWHARFIFGLPQNDGIRNRFGSDNEYFVNDFAIVSLRLKKIRLEAFKTANPSIALPLQRTFKSYSVSSSVMPVTVLIKITPLESGAWRLPGKALLGTNRWKQLLDKAYTGITVTGAEPFWLLFLYNNDDEVGTTVADR